MASLIAMLDEVFLSAEKEDKQFRFPDPKGQFSVRSFYDVLIGEQPIVSRWKFFWNKLVPPRVNSFLLGGSTSKDYMDNLIQIGHILVNGHPSCLG